MMVSGVKRERIEPQVAVPVVIKSTVIELSSSDSDSDADVGVGGGTGRTRVSNSGSVVGGLAKKAKADSALPLGFLDPLPLEEPRVANSVMRKGCRQFWKAGDFEDVPVVDSTSVTVGMDHVRVHPKFLHSNATSHKWALGALAELLDNALDEACHGATYVNIDMMENKKDGSKMLIVEDNGGGMDPDKMRHCMSLGYSAKSKIANTIGQYGNGFKTSTMRLGADVIVFSRSRGRDGKSPTQSIGLLSYSYLRNTGKEDIVVPMLDYKKGGQIWKRMRTSYSIDWNTNLNTIIDWSPYSSEADLLQQFSKMKDHGTRVVIYNLWEDDQGKLELDFDADQHDIQVRGVNRDENKIQMAKQFPNSRHFLTYRHSLRSYASMLYLRLPRGFRMILRGKEIEHHNIVTDMMMKEEVTYRPQPSADGVHKDPNMVAVVTMGFVKDAEHHIDVQGFNVYHKNRLIKPFWRVWNPPGSDGRGVIGSLEANFVEPAHDKQDFERTIVLSRLEARLVQMQKTYWSTKCHKIGYAPRRNKKLIESEDKESSPEAYQPSARRSGKGSKNSTSAIGSIKNRNHKDETLGVANERTSQKSGKNSSRRSALNRIMPDSEESDSEDECIPSDRAVNGCGDKAAVAQKSVTKDGVCPSLSSPSPTKGGGDVTADKMTTRLQSKTTSIACDVNGSRQEEAELSLEQLKAENKDLKERLRKMEESMAIDLQNEKDKNKSLAEQLEAAEKKLEELNKEQEALIDIFSEERVRRDKEEENLRKKLKDAQADIQKLQNQM
ncbi:protein MICRORCHIDIA 7-like [Dioscorea cayenensis subsp. rotundata]|uniref:Protein MICRORCHIDIA 7-like n=1 Tax=Dioscorea cayennensis subsp. rotundata TaxID=55577 RepID=A0AB40C0U8_DIOCR|nr:protein MICRORCHIDIA 7-like [Dioscorea cayenensis subsp. rotundata]